MNAASEVFMAEGRNLQTGLAPYTGTWGRKQLIHLMRRSLFGVSADHLAAMINLDMNAAVETLLRNDPDPAVPVNDYNTDDFTDPRVAFGESWLEDLNRDDSDLVSLRVISLKTWWISNILGQDLSLHEKMIYFWHNHLATQSWEVFWPSLTYDHFDGLRQEAFGNFKEMVRKITLDPHVLLYLNGAANNKFAPDENYARELQELFTIGKGPDAKFTESDVQAAARVLTGHSIDWEGGGTYLYRDYWHDEEDKQFSSFYNNKVIKGRSGEDGASEVDDMIEMIFENNEVAPFVARKMYRFFIHSGIDEQVEADVIQPLATIFRDANYEIRPVLKALLSSEHFYDEANHGAAIKSPLDFLLGFWRSFGVKMPENATPQNDKEIRNSLLWSMNNLGLEIMDPPNVAGYPAYYQIPQFDKHWISTNSITTRALQTDSFIYWGFWSEKLLTNVDLISFLKTMDHPEDPVQLIDDLNEIFLGVPLSQASSNRMLGVLLSGQQTNSYWTNAWFDHLDDPNNAMKKEVVESRLKVMFQFFLQRPEYHLF